ncbi:BCD family MFS transporter [Acetobacteraceae bacterium KSS8]|uniref:BCD family MFS transporter n=1 Tax=Endosaccharibacter trunci TaxID=2812733 RepID=A0ABT1W6N0_9PROT|nr:BCD family MFS transporter [Acetobacteraceae bacterium KSS8]
MSGVAPARSARWAEWLLPFARMSTPELPLGRILRLSLFQVSVGMALVLVIGTLNRVMIVELGVPAWLVATMIALPLVMAPLRAVIGHRSDEHRSLLGWRRLPFLWMGTLLQFGGFAIMPFALIVLCGDAPRAPHFVGPAASGLAFLLVGVGLHTVQTTGMALATDLAPPYARTKVVTLLCVMLLLGMLGSAVLFGRLLSPFSEIRLIQVIQGAAVLTLALNFVAVWKQEVRDPSRTAGSAPRQRFTDALRALSDGDRPIRRLVSVALGTIAFSMQDVLLEPYGGQVLHLPVAMTTALTALLAVGGLLGFTMSAGWLSRGADRYRLAAVGVLNGLLAFILLIFAAPASSGVLFAAGTLLIGFGSACFEVGTLSAAMEQARSGRGGLALGTWGGVQAFSTGLAILVGGITHDLVGALGRSGRLGATLAVPSVGYGAVYAAEIFLLFATLVAIGPLAAGPRFQLPVFPAASRPLGGSAT